MKIKIFGSYFSFFDDWIASGITIFVTILVAKTEKVMDFIDERKRTSGGLALTFV
jgi:hypothetical protein